MSSIPVGTVVSVSDGTPRPPERFVKKLSSWRTHNYLGVYLGIDGCGWHDIQELPRWLAQLQYLVIKRPRETLSGVSVVEPAMAFPVCPDTNSVLFEDALEAEMSRLKLVNGRVHTFVHAATLAGADIDEDYARRLVSEGTMNPIVPDRYRSLGHTLSRIHPKTGEVYYFETRELAVAMAA
jgi:hypothetical protein